MKVLGIHGSPRRAATEYILEQALAVAAEFDGVETQAVALARHNIKPCIHCNRCITENLMYCPVYKDDYMAELGEAVQEADVLVLATPVYQMAPSAQMMAFMNRLRPLGKLTSRGGWGGKFGVSIAVGGKRNGGEETALDVLNRFYLSQGMCLAGGGVYTYNGASIWSKNTREGAETDEVGQNTMKIAVRRAVVMALLTQAGQEQRPELVGCRLAGFKDEDERQAFVSAFMR